MTSPVQSFPKCLVVDDVLAQNQDEHTKFCDCTGLRIERTIFGSVAKNLN